MEFLRIVALGLGAAIAYGIAHDLVTAQVCVEHFTIGHPRIVDTESPVVLGLVWGVVATWWVGLPVGVLLAFAARAGASPKWTAVRLVRPVLGLLAAMAVLAAVAGVVGAVLADIGLVWLLEPLASAVPRGRHTVFLADAWAHGASYLVGAVGGAGLAGWIAIRRRREAGVPPSDGDSARGAVSSRP